MLYYCIKDMCAQGHICFDWNVVLYEYITPLISSSGAECISVKLPLAHHLVEEQTVDYSKKVAFEASAPS